MPDSSTTDWADRVLDDRAMLAKVIQRRPRVGPVLALAISLAFTLVATPIVTLDSWLVGTTPADFAPGSKAPRTLRVPAFSGYSNKRIEVRGGSVVVSYGESIDSNTAALAAAVIRDTPSRGSALWAYAGLLFLAAFLFATQLRRSNRGRLLRTQITTLAVLLLALLIAKILLLVTPISIFAISAATVAILMALTVDVSSGLSTALLASVLFGLAVPFDFGVFAVLGAQSAIPALLLGDRRHKFRRIAVAGLVGGLAAAALYATLFYLATRTWPFTELGAPLRSSLVATFAGSLAAAGVAALAKPGYQFLLGEISQNKLVELEDLSHPLLVRIAENSPGTWQHSLAMANMAEIAVNTIGGNGRLVRVGAYFHDLGKSLQPKYFIENLESGEQSPHDRLSPEVSCDAIFAHVTEGIRIARKHRLPERVIDFMHMHHGDGLLEYFWAKCQESGNPKKLTVDDFRYPGVPPQSRETAILAICDAVEAASRTLKKPDDQAVSNLVQRIVYGKLHLGQLDESGLSMADLRKISNSLRETIKHAHHGRIEYPWQREENRQSNETEPPGEAPVRPFDDGQSATQRIIAEPRLDSLDTPRPFWRDGLRQRTGASGQAIRSDAQPESGRAVSGASGASGRRELEVAPTAQMNSDGSATSSAEIALADTGLHISSEPGIELPAGDAERTSEAFDAVPTNQLPLDFQVEEPTSQAGPLLPTTTQRASLPPPPPPPRPDSSRKKPTTIELMKKPAPLPPAPLHDEMSDELSKDLSDELLAPGTMVLGPPPATRPDSKARSSRTGRGFDEPTFPGAPIPPVTIAPKAKRPATSADDSPDPNSPGKTTK